MTFRLIRNDEDPSIYDVTLEMPRGQVQLHFEKGMGSVHVFNHDGEEITQTARTQTYGMDHAHGQTNTSADVLCLMLWLCSHDWDKSIEGVAQMDAAAAGEKWDELDESMAAAYRQHAKEMVACFMRSIGST